MTKKVALKSLTALALTLPGITESKAETQALKPKTDMMYAKYSDGQRRYKIDIFQFMLQTPLGKNWDFSITGVRDSMSGATPAYYIPASFDDGDRPETELVEEWSGSSISENRSSITSSVRYFADNANYKFGLYISEEDDYEGRTASIQYQRELNKKATELTFGYSYASDRISPTIGAASPVPVRIKKANRFTNTFTAGIKQDLSPTNLILQNFEYIFERGFLSDPYRPVTIYEGFGVVDTSNIVLQSIINGANDGDMTNLITIIPEKRPKKKGQIVSVTKFIQYINPLNSAVHLTFRYVHNTWHMRSHTYTVTYYQPFLELYEASAEVRLYRQSHAKFYSMAFAAVPGSPFPAAPLGKHYSADYRLAHLGSLWYEVGLARNFAKANEGKIKVVGGWSRNRGNWGLGHKPYPHNPSNDFSTYYVAVNLSFSF